MNEASRPDASGVRPGSTGPDRGGYPHAGHQFYVWDEDAQTAAAWAVQLADVERSIELRRPTPPPA